MNQSQPKIKKTVCSRCQGDQFDTNEQGFLYCVGCNMIQQQNKFDNNVTFGEQNELQGKNVNKLDKFNQQSREKRLKRAENKINDLVKKLEIPPTYDKAVRAANRLLMYADNCNFFKKGKKIQLYAAAALYITLRFQKAPYLLIDFSDKMGIKMFPLARCFLKMSKKFGFQQQLPPIDPSLLIHRYCKAMNLGQKVQAVTMSAIRLIKRMKRDWMCLGRRPSSLCGAAILIATRIHGVSNSNCSTTQICKTVFVCDQTIRRRLDQFKQTKISKLTIEQFDKQDKQDQILGADSQMDPPAFRKARLRSQQQQEILAQTTLIGKKKGQDYDDMSQQQIPQSLIQRYSDQLGKIYERASDRPIPIEENLEQQLESGQQSNNTGGQGQQEEDNSDFDQKLIFLDEKQQDERKKIWQDYNKAWLDKQAAKAERGEIQVKKNKKQTKKQQKTDSPYQAIVKRPEMSQNVNRKQLKKLLCSKPKEEEQEHNVSLHRIFNAFKFKMTDS